MSDNKVIISPLQAGIIQEFSRMVEELEEWFVKNDRHLAYESYHLSLCLNGEELLTPLEEGIQIEYL